MSLLNLRQSIFVSKIAGNSARSHIKCTKIHINQLIESVVESNANRIECDSIKFPCWHWKSPKRRANKPSASTSLCRCFVVIHLIRAYTENKNVNKTHQRLKRAATQQFVSSFYFLLLSFRSIYLFIWIETCDRIDFLVQNSKQNSLFLVTSESRTVFELLSTKITADTLFSVYFWRWLRLCWLPFVTEVASELNSLRQFQMVFVSISSADSKTEADVSYARFAWQLHRWLCGRPVHNQVWRGTLRWQTSAAIRFQTIYSFYYCR